MKFHFVVALLLGCPFSFSAIACPNFSGLYQDGQGLALSYRLTQHGCKSIDVNVVDQNGKVINSFTEHIDGKFRHNQSLGEDIMYTWNGNTLVAVAYEDPDAGGWGFHRVTSSLSSKGDLQNDEQFLQGNGYSGKISYVEKHL